MYNQGVWTKLELTDFYVECLTAKFLQDFIKNFK